MYEALTDYLPKIQDSDSWVRDTSCFIDYTPTVNEFRKKFSLLGIITQSMN